MSLSKPFENCYWLKPGLLLAGEVPVATDESFTRLKLAALFDAGIRVFINLLADEPLVYESLLMDLAEDRGINYAYLHFPIIDMATPENGEMTEILDAIDIHLEKKEPVYFHCYAGLGRTGIVSCCWLARHRHIQGKAIFQALDTIRADQNHLEYWDSPQSQIQFDFVLNWKEGS